MRRSAVAPPAAPGWCLRSGKLSDHVASQRKDLTRTRVDCPIVSHPLRVFPARIDKDEVLPAITVVIATGRSDRQENTRQSALHERRTGDHTEVEKGMRPLPPKHEIRKMVPIQVESAQN